jgi:hypothetical protein
MDTTALRRVLNRFSIEDRDSRGRRVIAGPVFNFFSRMRKETGYLTPRGISRADLLAAAQKAAATELAA